MDESNLDIFCICTARPTSWTRTCVVLFRRVCPDSLSSSLLYYLCVLQTHYKSRGNGCFMGFPPSLLPLQVTLSRPELCRLFWEETDNKQGKWTWLGPRASFPTDPFCGWTTTQRWTTCTGTWSWARCSRCFIPRSPSGQRDGHFKSNWRPGLLSGPGARIKSRERVSRHKHNACMHKWLVVNVKLPVCQNWLVYMHSEIWKVHGAERWLTKDLVSPRHEDTLASEQLSIVKKISCLSTIGDLWHFKAGERPVRGRNFRRDVSGGNESETRF